jgi:hypothetical protein
VVSYARLEAILFEWHLLLVLPTGARVAAAGVAGYLGVFRLSNAEGYAVL